jgi:hypothetical protein
MMECGAKFRAEVSRIERSRNGWHRVFFDIVQLTEMTSKRRPVRRGAPNYREAWRTGQLVKQPKSEQTTVEVLTGPSQARKFIVGWFLALIAVLVGIAAVVTYLGPKV